MKEKDAGRKPAEEMAAREKAEEETYTEGMAAAGKTPQQMSLMDDFLLNQQTLFDITTNILNSIKAILEKVIYKNFSELLTDRSVYDKMSKASNPYGDGFASERIADILEGKISVVN